MIVVFGSNLTHPNRENTPMQTQTVKTVKTVAPRRRQRRASRNNNVSQPIVQYTTTNRSSRSRSRKQPVQKLVMSSCARDYLQCLVNPFDGPLACVPSDFLNNNRIARTFVRGSFACGPNVGFIAMDPFYMQFNDYPAVISSNSSFAGTTIDLNDTANINLALSNSDYTTAVVGPGNAGLSWRVVGAGLRFRYRGTELNRGGTIHALHDPTHDSLQGRSVSVIDGELQARQLPVTTKWTTILYRPVSPDDLELSITSPGSTTKSPNITAIVPRWYIGAVITPPSNSTLSSFEYEAACVCEYQGRNVRGQVTTHADPVGLSAALQSVVDIHPSQIDSKAVTHTAFQNVLHAVREGITHMAATTAQGDLADEHFKSKNPPIIVNPNRRQSAL